MIMNRYTILSISIIALILIFVSFDIGEEEEMITGFADEIKDSDSGFTFYINDGDGSRIRSFSSIRPDNMLHEFSGSYSDDGNIFFVSEIK